MTQASSYLVFESLVSISAGDPLLCAEIPPMTGNSLPPKLSILFLETLILTFISKLKLTFSNFHVCPKPCVLGLGTKRTSQTWKGYPIDLITFLPPPQIFCLQTKHLQGI